MTNVERVQLFVTKHPGYTQSEISSQLNITPEQQVYQILRKLIKRNLLKREQKADRWRYYAVSTPTSDDNALEGGRAEGDSMEQREAETWLISKLAGKLGVRLQKKTYRFDDGGWLELDGFCESPLILCEAWAHIGSPKSAQKNKPIVDSVKLQYVSTHFKKDSKRILLFGDHEAASYYQGRSWRAQYLNKQNIAVEIIEFTPQIREKILKAQERQRR